MKSYLALIICLFFGLINYAQHLNCRTTPAALPMGLQQGLRMQQDTCSTLNRIDRNFLVSVHIARDSTETSGVSNLAQVQLAIDTLNVVFAPIGATFSICSDEIMADFHYSIWNKFEDLPNALIYNYRPNTINLYVVSGVEEPTSFITLDGDSGFPGEPDYVTIKAENTFINKRAFIHEMGHFFGLYHTYETSTGLELMDHSNCSTTGDLICDTNTDVVYSFNNPFSCIAQNDPIFDSAGAVIAPPFDNYMSDYPDACVCRFTLQQYNRMVMLYNEFRTNLW